MRQIASSLAAVPPSAAALYPTTQPCSGIEWTFTATTTKPSMYATAGAITAAPRTGYTQADPVFTEGRSDYSYAFDNPLLFIDRDGREPAFNNPEQKCLLCTVYAEARGTSTACQQAVASVINNRVREAQNRGKAADVCSVVSAPGQFNGFGNPNYKQCEKGCLPAFPPELQQLFNNFQNGFSVNPQDATFFGNNSAAMTKYFSGTLGLTKVPFPSCQTFQFYKK